MRWMKPQLPLYRWKCQKEKHKCCIQQDINLKTVIILWDPIGYVEMHRCKEINFGLWKKVRVDGENM